MCNSTLHQQTKHCNMNNVYLYLDLYIFIFCYKKEGKEETCMNIFSYIIPQVANIVGRAEVLSAIFYLLSIYSFLKFTYSMGHKSRPTYTTLLWAGCVPILAMLALFCKEQGVTCLGVCLVHWLFNWWSTLPKKNEWYALFYEYNPFLLVLDGSFSTLVCKVCVRPITV